MKKKLFLLLVLVSIVSSGCYDRIEINQLAIVNSELFDYKNNEIIFIAEIINPKTQSATSTGVGPQAAPYIYVKSTGKTVMDSLYNANIVANKSLYTAHVKAIFITEEYARKKGLATIIDSLSRYRDSRQGQYLVIVKGEETEQLFKSSTTLSDYFGDYVEEIKKGQNYRLSKTIFVKSLDVIKDYYNDGKQPTVGVVERKKVAKEEETNLATDNKEKSMDKLRFEGLAIFKKDKLIDFLDGQETELYNLMSGKIMAMSLSTKKTTFKITGVKPNVNFSYKKDKVNISVKMNINMIVENDTGKKIFNNIKTLKKLEESVNKDLKVKLEKFLLKSQKEIGVDFMGLGSKYHISKPKDWKKLRKKWDKYFSNANIKVNVSSSILGEGKTTKSFELED